MSQNRNQTQTVNTPEENVSARTAHTTEEYEKDFDVLCRIEDALENPNTPSGGAESPKSSK